MKSFQHPWMVTIQTEEGFLHCGGSILSSNKIATAAHCFISKDKNRKMTKDTIQTFKVVAGTDTPYATHGELSIIRVKRIFKEKFIFKLFSLTNLGLSREHNRHQKC